VTLERELWHIFVHDDDEALTYMLPRPDNFAGGSDCLPSGKSGMPGVNELSVAEALDASTCLHAKLRFEAAGGDSGWDVTPIDLPGDVAEVCRRNPKLAQKTLAPACTQCMVRSVLNPSLLGGCPSIYIPYSETVAKALAIELNALYGIAPEG